ncbi:MAG: 4Fe-4S binding protein [Rhizobiales bacterium]|nr:4Fe-4S binding protein [Hyphomicrobiales bacterium]
MFEAATRAPEFRQLKAGDPIVFSSESCLIVRRPGVNCGLCREACPAGVLTGGQWSITLETEGCIGCGLCAAACPTGALMVEGCTPYPLNAAGERIVLECRRVAPADRDPNAVTVPCLGGLTTPDLLDFVEETEATVVLADRGWCSDCAVGRCNAPWQSTFDESRALLGAIDGRLADGLAVERKELPISRAEPIMAALRPDKHVGRREFLRRLVGAVEPRDPLAESRRVVFGRGLVTPVRRERILDRIEALAADLERAIPASMVPAIKIADGCELNGLCAAICPTGALRRDEDGETISLEFDAAGCITCGLCQRVCASKALSLWPEGDGRTLGDAPETLVKRRAIRCVGCDESFVPADDEQSCPYCEKTMNVMRGLASLKAGAQAPN